MLAHCLASSASASPPARIDASLAGRGFLFTAIEPPSPSPPRTRVAEDARGRLVALTSAADELVVARHLRSGRLDPTFGAGGIARVSLGDDAARRGSDEVTAGAVAIQPDGKILLGGSYDPDLIVEGGSGSRQLVLARLKRNGGIDRAFGGNAKLGTPRGLALERRGANVLAIALQGRRIVTGGEAAAGAAYVSRYTPRGALDRSFGRGTGAAHFARRRARGAVASLIAAPSGKVYAAGYLGVNFLLARLNRDGTPDRAFGRLGRVLTGAARRRACGCSLGEGLVRDRHGRLLVSGTLLARRPPGYFDLESAPGANAVAVARYRPNGMLDRSFGRGGIARTGVGAETRGRGIAMQRDGRIVVAGSSVRRTDRHTRVAVVRYRPDGARDRRFFGDGVLSRSFGAAASAAWDPLVDRSRRIVIAGAAVFGASAGAHTSGILLTRLLPGR